MTETLLTMAVKILTTIKVLKEIKEVQNSVDRILQNGPKITDAIGRLETLDGIIADTDKRIEALNSVTTGIKKTQLDLEGMNREVNSKFKILQNMKFFVLFRLFYSIFLPLRGIL